MTVDIIDLIVHGILDPNRSLEDIKQEMKGIFERLVRTIVHPPPPFLHLVHSIPLIHVPS
jgi:hypothetical protein